MSRFVVQHPFLAGAILVSGPLAYCIATAFLSWWDGARNLTLPLVFIALWLAYMASCTCALVSFVKADRRPRIPVAPSHAPRFTDHLSRFDPHSN